jgi:dihydroorotate dehydrogenase electron transfer subunit
MARHHVLPVAEQRALRPDLHLIELAAPELSTSARPGQFVMLRCAPPGSLDPLLRRPFFVAGADRARGRLQLLCWQQGRGGRYLVERPPGPTLDILGLLGKPFALDSRTRTLLLIGEGWGAAPLIFLAQEALRRNCAVTLALVDETPLPPALLPPDLEVHLGLHFEPAERSDPRPPVVDLAAAIQWADQLCAALPLSRLAPLAEAVRAAKYRWASGFAQVALTQADPGLPFVACGLGLCSTCAFETRRGWRSACEEGLVFDLRETL